LGSFYKIAASLQQPATGFQHSAVKPNFQRARLRRVNPAQLLAGKYSLYGLGVRDFVEKGVFFAG